MGLDSTQRFSSRVADYVKYRPCYPRAALTLLCERCGLAAGAPVADLGSGSGILTAQLLEAGARVWAVEPNREMREAAERGLGGRDGFTSVVGTAEETTLAANSVVLVTAAQAFHWFDPARARAEALRIVRPGGSAALLWNETPRETPPFMADYEALLRRYAPEYEQVRRRRACRPTLQTFFGGNPERATFIHRQEFDFEGLKGRALSSSYVPEPGESAHEPFVCGLREVFERHQHGGRVTFPYETLVYFARLG